MQPLLKVLLSWQQTVLVPAVVRNTVEDIKYYLVPPASLGQLPDKVKLVSIAIRYKKVKFRKGNIVISNQLLNNSKSTSMPSEYKSLH